MENNNDKFNEKISEQNFSKKDKKKKSDGVKRNIIDLILLLIIVFLFSVLSGDYTSSDTEETLKKNSEQITKLESENESLKTENEELKKKVEEAEPWFKKKEDEKKAEADKIRKEQEAKEKKEAEAREKEEKQGYETGITYDQLARTPDKYVGKSVKFSGKVIQVIEAGTEVQMRLAVNNNYDTILYCAVPKSEMNGSRILENDKITIYGMSNGIITYESTLGGKISIPSVIIDKYE
ncbi:hypothetical protein [Finegoldia magna]|uniref:hypothetical protein n=1 Tax=Finegoldia magna TaxID=1260 RepID=UPI0025F2F884|nr:hypothetical protein [Finegoldia magna]MBS5776384.1 hypothetical protein [Finegoldia magna]MDU1400071.1 hypothetical protein [Finegoldia magna]MDU2574399.1 hypothetical protein [Finegoldia magna]